MPNSKQTCPPIIMLILQRKLRLSIYFHFYEFSIGWFYVKNISKAICYLCMGGEENLLLTLPLEVVSWLLGFV